MESNTLFKWILNKVGVLLVITVIIITWVMADARYSRKTGEIEKQLYIQAVKLKNAGRDLKRDEGFAFSLVDSTGKAIFDDSFGSHTGFGTSESFRDALSGKQSMRYENKSRGSFITLWMPFEYNNKPHVLVLRKVNNHSKLSSFIFCFFTSGLVILVLFGLILRKISGSFTKAVTSIEIDIKETANEKFGSKSPFLDSAEFDSLYKELNRLCKRFNNEFSQLRKDLKQWEVFFSTIPRGLLAIDDERQVINCNQNALDLLNVKDKTALEAVNQSVMAVFRNADMNHITSDFFESGNFIKEYEFEVMIENIMETVKVLCVELDIGGKSEKAGAMIIMENITALRRLENMRKDFVANVSHELKTPISIIGGFAETLKECLDDPANALNFIKIIENNTSRLTYIIDDLLSLSKLEQNESMIKKDFDNTDISETVKLAIDLCSHEAEKKQIFINLELEETKYYEKPTMLANHRLLEHAVRNLIENAIRYSPKQSEISVSTRKVGDEIEIAVRDSGAGISEEHQDKIFERFYRVDKSRDRQTGGSGLGLAIVKHIARIHGGRVELESAPEEGSCFKLILPYTLDTLSAAAY